MAKKAYISKQRTFAYKTVQITGKNQSFQDLLIGAFQQLSRARSRSKQLPEDEDRRRVANRFDPVRGMLTGAMFDYVKGQARNCIVEDDEAENFSISQVAPPADGKKRKEFLDSIIYFAVLENHVVMMGSQALGPSHFENYVDWLLRRAGIFSDRDMLKVVDQVPIGRRLHGVKSISLAEHNLFRSTSNGSFSETETTVVNGGFLSKTARALVKELLAAQRGGKTLSEAIHPDSIEVKVEITCKKLKRGDSEPMLDDMADMFRHVEGIDPAFELAGGGRVKSSELRISAPKSVMCIDGIPDPADLFKKMAEWLDSLFATGKIEGE